MPVHPVLSVGQKARARIAKQLIVDNGYLDGQPGHWPSHTDQLSQEINKQTGWESFATFT
jgi:hypothetical protein